jgi:K+/H+ antiporter YhaU regulatory subunit KhtT
MNASYTTPAITRLAAFLAAVLTSAVVLGSTVAGMQPREDAGASLIALQRAATNTTAVR